MSLQQLSRQIINRNLQFATVGGSIIAACVQAWIPALGLTVFETLLLIALSGLPLMLIVYGHHHRAALERALARLLATFIAGGIGLYALVIAGNLPLGLAGLSVVTLAMIMSKIEQSAKEHS